MRKIQYILSGIALITLPLGVHAQQQAKDSTVNRTVVVEQEYTPDIPDASKINVLPQVEAPTANKKGGGIRCNSRACQHHTCNCHAGIYWQGDASQNTSRIYPFGLWQLRQSGRTRRLSVHIVRPRPPQPEFPDERHGRQTRFTRQRRQMEFLLLSHSCQYGLCAPLQESRPERCGQLRIEQLQFPARCSRQKTEVHFR